MESKEISDGPTTQRRCVNQSVLHYLLFYVILFAHLLVQQVMYFHSIFPAFDKLTSLSVNLHVEPPNSAEPCSPTFTLTLKEKSVLSCTYSLRLYQRPQFFFVFFFCFLQRFFSYPFWCGFLNSFCLTNSPVSLLFYYGGASQNNCLVGLDMYCCSLKSALTCMCVFFFFL